MTLYANPAPAAAFSHYEIHGVHTITIAGEQYTETVDDERAEVFTLYGRYGPLSGRVGCQMIGSFETRREALRILACMIGPLPVFDPLPA